jgi:phasin family protein
MAIDNNPFGDVTQMMEKFKLPGVDMSTIVEARRKDIEALVEANKSAYESMQALANKQTEVFTQAMQGIQDAVKNAAGGIGGLTDPSKQAELAQKACQKTLGDMKEIADMARKSQMDVITTITQRAALSMQDVKRMLVPKK